jgi:hypothetical protein
MGRIEYWLLGAVAALIVFIALEGFNSAAETHRYALQIEQAGHPRGEGGPVRPAATDSSDARDAALTPSPADVHSRVSKSRTPAPVRNVADVRRRIADGSRRTYILDMLAGQDSNLVRWPDNVSEGLRVWIQAEPHIPDWWTGYVQTARDVFLEWETAGIPLRFHYPSDSAGADIVIRWIDRFPPNDARIGNTHREYDQNGWITGAIVTIPLHDGDGDRLPVGEINAILRHEVGHAIGMGHSRDRGTIMFPENTALELTELDKETLHLLYTLPPGRVR